MRKKALIFASVLLLMALSACNKPSPQPEPTPTPGSEITTNNVAPGGFTDDGPQSWYE